MMSSFSSSANIEQGRNTTKTRNILPTDSIIINFPRVARLCRLANLEISLKDSLVMYEQKTTTAEAPGKTHNCMCTTCKRSALHNRKVPFMLNTLFISNEKSRYKPTYIEFMEAKDENDDIMPSHSPKKIAKNSQIQIFG